MRAIRALSLALVALSACSRATPKPGAAAPRAPRTASEHELRLWGAVLAHRASGGRPVALFWVPADTAGPAAPPLAWVRQQQVRRRLGRLCTDATLLGCRGLSGGETVLRPGRIAEAPPSRWLVHTTEVGPPTECGHVLERVYTLLDDGQRLWVEGERNLAHDNISCRRADD